MRLPHALRRLFKRKAVLGPLASTLLEAMKAPGWEQKAHTLDHKAFKLRVWVSNGPKYLRIYELNGTSVPEGAPGFRFTDVEQTVLWEQYLSMQQNDAAETLRNLMLVSEFKDKE